MPALSGKPQLPLAQFDRGLWDRADRIDMVKQPLKQGLSSQAALAIARERQGSELLIRQGDDRFDLYALQISEADKQLLSTDFESDAVRIYNQRPAPLSGHRAYVLTHDNMLRLFEANQVVLKDPNQPFIQTDLTLELHDFNGLETHAKNDIYGVVSGDIRVAPQFLESVLKQATIPGLQLALEVQPQAYHIHIQGIDRFDLAEIVLKPENGGIEAIFETRGMARGLQVAGEWVDVDVEKYVTRLITDTLTQKLGLQVASRTHNQFKLVPDFTNTDILKQLPLAHLNLNLENVALSQASHMALSDQGELVIHLDKAQVWASSNAKGAQVQPDLEGVDQVKTRLVSELRNDFETRVTALGTELKLNLTPEESPVFQNELQRLTGTGLEMGPTHISGLDIQLALGSEGEIHQLQLSSRPEKGMNLLTGIEGKPMDLKISGALEVQPQGKGLEIKSENIALKGYLDGLLIETQQGATGRLKITDSGKVNLSDLSYQMSIEGVQVQHHSTTLNQNDQGGYQLNLNAQMITQADKLYGLLAKLKGRDTLPEPVREALGTGLAAAQKTLKDFEVKGFAFKQTQLKLGPDFAYQSLSSDVALQVSDAVIQWRPEKKAPLKWPELALTMKAEHASQGLKLSDGLISFELNQELRQQLAQELTGILEDQNLINVKLEVTPQGQVKIDNLTYEVFSTPVDKLGRAIEDVDIPLLSPVLGRTLRLTDISADLKLDIQIKDKALEITIDETSINQLLGFLTTKLTDALHISDLNAKVAKEAADLTQRLNSRKEKGKNVFELDLQSLVAQYLNPDVQFESAGVNADGRFELRFNYQQSKSDADKSG